MNFVAEQVSNKTDRVGAVFFFRQSGVNKQLVHDFAVFGRVEKVRNFEHEELIFYLPRLGIDSIELARPEEQLDGQEAHFVHGAIVANDSDFDLASLELNKKYMSKILVACLLDSKLVFDLPPSNFVVDKFFDRRCGAVLSV